MSAFDKIIGYDTIRKELERIADALRCGDAYTRLGVTPPRGLMLHGEPGVGKSLMARCVIEESGRRAFTCRKDRPDGEFINAIRDTFTAAAEHAPSIVFLDDLDKFANSDGKCRDEEEYVTVQSCIDEMRGKDVFVLATANGINHLPDSLVRTGRFDRTIRVETPLGEDARRIVAHYLSGKSVLAFQDEDPAQIASTVADLMVGHSCADLETVVNEAGLLAGQLRQEHIRRDHLIRACLLVSDGISPDSIVLHREDDPADPRSIMTRTACHEAGHAVVAEVLSPGSVSMVCIHNNVNGSRGFTSYRPVPGRDGLQEDVDGVMRSLAGKAALEQRFGRMELGTGHDLAQARRKLFDLIMQGVYGFALLELPRQVDSESLLARREAVAVAELERLYLRARQIIAENRAFLDALIAALLERGWLTGDEVREIKTRCGA